jgi:hypothetical protein
MAFLCMLDQDVQPLRQAGLSDMHVAHTRRLARIVPMADQAGVIKDRLTQSQIVLLGGRPARTRFSRTLFSPRRRCCRGNGPLISMDISIARLSDNRRRVRENLAGRFITAPAADRLNRNEYKREPDYPVSRAVPQIGRQHGPLVGTPYFIEMSHAPDDITPSAPPG